MSLKQRILSYIAIKLGTYIHLHSREIAEQTLPAFKVKPRNLSIAMPHYIGHPERITIGDDVTLGPGCRLIPVLEYPGTRMRTPGMNEALQRFDPQILIGNRVNSTAQLQIFSQERVTIEDDVILAANVFLNDGSHGYQKGDMPFKSQPLEQIAPITIGRGSWIGQNVVILGGVTVGEYCLIGANSVVTKSIPANSVAVGNPARVIRRWDQHQQLWIAADN